MTRVFSLLYAGLAYLLAMANLAYIIGFLTDFAVPKTVNSGAYDGGLWRAVTIDVVLVLGFGLLHSVTARRWFKRRWTRIVPAHLERATYLYVTAATTALLVVLWQPIPLTVWQVESFWAGAALITTCLAVWGTMFAATFHFGHFGFFGLAQAWRWVRRQPAPEASFTAKWLYAATRHPISLGWMVTPWLTPHLTVGQMVFGIAVAVYVLAATPFEEADLVAEFGERYRRYRAEVPAFLPRLFSRRRRAAAAIRR